MPQLEFNPYRDWLGLTEVPSDFYGLLGLQPFECDLDTIRKAAHRSTSTVRNIKPGDQIQVWKTLLDQIERAKESLSDPGLKADYDRRLRSNRDIIVPVTSETNPRRSNSSSKFDPMAPLDESYPPRASAPARPNSCEVQPPPPNAIEMGEATEAAEEPDEQVAPVGSSVSSPAARHAYRRRARRKQRVSRYLAVIVVCLAFVGLAVAFWLFLNRDPWSSRVGSDSQVAARPLVAGDSPQAASTERVQPPYHDMTLAADSAREANSAAPIAPRTAKNPINIPAPRDQETSPLPPSKPEPTAADEEELRRLLGAAYRALNAKEFERCEQLLQQARTTPMNPDGEAMVERLATLHEYVVEFWQAVDDGLKQVEGSELQLNQQTVFVVEVDSSSVVLRSLGRNRRIDRDHLPSELALALADQWFDQNAASSKVFKGAYMAVTPRYPKDEVRRTWAAAVREGAQLGDLMQVLDDQEKLDRVRARSASE